MISGLGLFVKIFVVLSAISLIRSAFSWIAKKIGYEIGTQRKETK